jgi:alpha-glucosidase
MQWTTGPAAGFTTGRPWLRVAPDAATRNVDVQAADPDSVLATYRRLLRFRRTSDALRRGTMTRPPSGDPDVLAWTRGGGAGQLLVLVSFTGEPRRVCLDDIAPGPWAPCVGTHLEPAAPDADGSLLLRPDEALVLARADA